MCIILTIPLAGLKCGLADRQLSPSGPFCMRPLVQVIPLLDTQGLLAAAQSQWVRVLLPESAYVCTALSLHWLSNAFLLMQCYGLENSYSYPTSPVTQEYVVINDLINTLIEFILSTVFYLEIL